MSPQVADDTAATTRVASAVSLSAGLWFFASPWVHGVNTSTNAWNEWVVGAAVATLAAIRLSYPMTRVWMSWATCLLGAWIFASPFIYAYADDTGRFVNSLCVGGIVAFSALVSTTATLGPPMSLRPARARNGGTIVSRVH
jgi:hypothetical protein